MSVQVEWERQEGWQIFQKFHFPDQNDFNCSLLTVQPHWRCYWCIRHCYRASKIDFQSAYINIFKSLLDPLSNIPSRAPLEFSKFDVHGTQLISQLKKLQNDPSIIIKNFSNGLFTGFNEITALCDLFVLTSFGASRLNAKPVASLFHQLFMLFTPSLQTVEHTDVRVFWEYFDGT